MKPKIAVIGGGTGSYTLLMGLKYLNCDLYSIVTVADSGGSTGRLRDEFGYLPMGDFRMSLVGMASDDADDVIRKLMTYRFDRGETGLRGHNLGNLLLVALTDILKSEEKAFEYVSRILNVKGRVIPITTSQVTLVANYEDGTRFQGEAAIDFPGEHHNGAQRITKLSLLDEVHIGHSAEAVLKEADYITIGPGDLYTSLLANIVVPGTAETIKKSKAKFIYIANLMSKWGQTHDFTQKDYVEELYKYIGRYPDIVLVNNKELPKEILELYEKENGHKIVDDLDELTHIEVVRTDLLADESVKTTKGDMIKRSLIRHSSEKLAAEINKLLFKERLYEIQSGMNDILSPSIEV